MIMKPGKLKFLTIPALLLAAGLSSATAASIMLGDTIVIDFGKTDFQTSGNWNNVHRSPVDPNNYFGSGTVELAGDLIRFSDGAATGVSLATVGGTANSSSGVGGATVASVGASAAFTVSGTIPDNAQVDVMYVNTGTVSLEFAGLDTSLLYNIELMSKLDAARNANPIVVNGTSISVDPNSSPFVVAFNGIAADGDGKIFISFPDAGSGADLQHINALELTAIPEPSTALLGGLGLLALLRRRRA